MKALLFGSANFFALPFLIIKHVFPQVHKHQTSRGSARGHHSTSARQPLPAATAQASQGASRGSIRKDTVAPEQSYEQASNWVQPGEGRGAPGAAGQSRGRKKRLAANFHPE